MHAFDCLTKKSINYTCLKFYNHEKKSFFNFLLTFFLTNFSLYAQECTQRYREAVFDDVSMDGHVRFGESLVQNSLVPLHYDVYMPKGDTAALRPLLILWHGGAFLDIFTKTSPDIVQLAKSFAKLGYVVISPDYRGIRDFTEFLQKGKLVQEVMKAVIDGNKAICHILDLIDNHGNPYRINKDEIFAGGVSGGGVLGLHLILLNEIDDLPESIRHLIDGVDNGVLHDLIGNKYCGNENILKSFFNISGALVATDFMQYTPTTFEHYHGTKDAIVPHGAGKPLGGMTAAPGMYGSMKVHEKMLEVGIHSILHLYPGIGHVPFLNLDLVNLLQQVNVVNEELYIETVETMAEHMFAKIECEQVPSVPTGIHSKNYAELKFYPNPVEHTFRIELPENGQWQVQVFDVAGKIVLQNNFKGVNYEQPVTDLAKGMYAVQIHELQNPNQKFKGKFIRN